MNILELHGVRKSYPGRPAALDGVTLNVAPGETVALLGASGSGKTTLLNLMAGLDRADAGSIRFLGQELTGLSEGRLTALRRRHMGFVFQTLNLVPTLTASENIELALTLAGKGKAEGRNRAEELLACAGLAGEADRLPEDLSLGQQQRVAVLRAVAHEPELVLMDEPTSALDKQTARTLMQLGLELNRGKGRCVVIATHDARLAEMLPRTLPLSDGRIEGGGGGGT